MEIFKTFKPKLSALDPYIDYYYLHKTSDKNFRNEYVYYPHYKHAISIYKNCKIRYNNIQSFSIYDEATDYESIYVQAYKHPLKVTQIGAIEKIAIAFKPLGLAHFIPMHLDQIWTTSNNYFNPYPGDEWKLFLSQLFESETIDEKTLLLDTFFSKHFKPLKNKIIIKAVDCLLSDYNQKVGELSSKLGIHRRTLFRLFKQNMGYGPEDFKTVVRFRHSLNSNIFSPKEKKLTEIAYESDFYDQADLIKNYKKITGISPGQFFKKGRLLGDEDIFWTFPKE